MYIILHSMPCHKIAKQPHPSSFRLFFRHATSPVDYRMNNELRMSATIYIADVSEENVDSIMEE
jgi:hypothetical protein